MTGVQTCALPILMWLKDDRKIQIEIQELKVNEISGEIENLEIDSDLADLAMVRFPLHLSQVKEFIRRSERVIDAGREPCLFCGLPINRDGHLCPRANGYRR